MKEMGLLSSPLVKILGGHGVICYYCFLFFVSNHPSELETQLDLAEVHSGAPSRSPQVSLPFCFIGHKVKNKTIPFQLFHLLVFAPAPGVPEEMPEQEPHLVGKGQPHLGVSGCVSLAQGKFNQQEGCDPKKAALKVNFYCFFFLLLLYLFPNVFLARVIEVIATVPKETNKKKLKKKREHGISGLFTEFCRITKWKTKDG